MHFCSDELQIILMVLNDGAEHVGRYLKALVIYTRYKIGKLL